jgi:hypothetical protein
MSRSQLRCDPSVLLDLQRESEPVLDVDDIQGDVLLGFNKPFNVQLVFNLKKTEDTNYTSLKQWLKNFPCTTPAPP